MDTRNIDVTLEKAQEWYKKGGELKELALQAFTERELKGTDFRCITTMNDVLRVLDIDRCGYHATIDHLSQYSKASVAAFKLNLVRKALNFGQKEDFMEGEVWYPCIPAVLSDRSYHKDSHEVEAAKVKIGCSTFTLFGGCADASSYDGLGTFDSYAGVAYSIAHVGFLGCATKEIARHMGKYFAKLIFEAKYGDLIDFEWIS